MNISLTPSLQVDQNRVVSQKQCRHCGGTLDKAANSPRDRFCCPKCEEGFYRVHCRVCERPIEAKNSRRQLCDRRRCRAEFRRLQKHNPGTFDSIEFSPSVSPSRYPHMGAVSKRDKNSTKSKAFLPENGGGTWVRIAGPIFSESSSFHAATLPLDSGSAAHYARSRKTAIAERDRRIHMPPPLIGPHDSPVNIVGGYRFPGASKIDLSPIAAANPVLPTETHAGASDSLDFPNLDIPQFLCRSPAPEATR
jgi:hypothetical protein